MGSGAAAGPQDTVEVEYVLRRSNGYFIYSTVEGISFQPSDVPIGPVDLSLVRVARPSRFEELNLGVSTNPPLLGLMSTSLSFLRCTSVPRKPPHFQ